MTDYSSDWTIGVVSQSRHFEENLKNALLYADEVLWLPTAVPIFRSLGDVRAATDYVGDLLDLGDAEEREDFADFLTQTLAGLEADYAAQRAFLEKIRDDELPIRLPTAYHHPYAESLAEGVAYVHVKARKGPDYMSRLLRETALTVAPSIELHAERAWGSPLEGSHVAVFDGDGQERVLLPSRWRAYPATQVLLDAVRRILLPDLGRLEIDEILELREDARDELGAMRGELLKLSASLRTLAGEGAPYETVVREAENLVATEVESEVLRVRAKLAQIEAGSRRALLGKAGEVFGLVLGGFFDPGLWIDAFKKTLKIPQDALDREGPGDIASGSTLFVLKAERFIETKAGA